MFKGSDLTSPKKTVDESIESYKSSKDGLSGKWEGESFTKFNTEADNFINKFKPDIDNIFSSLENCCSQYDALKELDAAWTTAQEELKAAKTEENTAKANYEAAKGTDKESEKQKEYQDAIDNRIAKETAEKAAAEAFKNAESALISALGSVKA